MASLDQFLGISYKLTTSENFDELMKELGVGLVTRKLGNTVSPTIVLVKEGDVFTLKTSSTFKNSQISFKEGEEFEEETPDGRKVKSIITIDGNKMNHIQDGDKKTVIVREFDADKVVAKMTVNSVTCTRTYERVQ